MRTLTRGLTDRTISKNIRGVELPQKGLLSNVDSNPVNLTVNGSSIVSARVTSAVYPTILGRYTTANPSWTKGVRSRGIGFSGNLNPVQQTSSFKSSVGVTLTSTIALINANAGIDSFSAGVVMTYNAQWRIYNPLRHVVFDGFNGGSQDTISNILPESVKPYSIYETVNTIRSKNFIQSDSFWHGLKNGLVDRGYLTGLRTSMAFGFVQSQLRISNVADFIESANYFMPNSITRQNAKFVLDLTNSKISKYINGV